MTQQDGLHIYLGMLIFKQVMVMFEVVLNRFYSPFLDFTKAMLFTMMNR